MAIRVYQIAKEYSRTPEEVIRILRDAGISVTSQTSALDEHAIHTVNARLGKFKLTVVDGEHEAQIAKEQQEEKPPPPKKKKASPKKKMEEKPKPSPRLAVRVIKKHEEVQPPAPAPVQTQAPAPAPPPEPEPKAMPVRRLKRPKGRGSRLAERIHKLAEQRGQELGQKGKTGVSANGAVASGPAPPRTSAATPPAASARETPAEQADARNRARQKKAEKRGERPIQLPAPKPPARENKAKFSRNDAGRKKFEKRPVQTPGFPPPFPPREMKPGGSPPSKGAPIRPRYGSTKTTFKKKKKKRRNVEQIDKIKVVTTSKVLLPQEELGIIMLSEGVTVKELADKVDRKAKDVIKRLFEKGIMATLNDVLDSELALEVAKDFGYLAEIVSFEEDLQLQEEDNLVVTEGDTDAGEPRSPIVTIMGHVDHGKTTLLDAIRATRVATGEAGGITQHIGAYAVPCKDKEIVFLDTPGHEAFTKMRARGASVTDIVVLVVAADDGVKPQTIEAISHAKAAKVPIITCINKIDKPDASPDRVKQMLTEHELIVEDFGGDSPCVQVSAKTQVGIGDLLEMILLVAELHDYKANPKRKARGTVIEARLDRGRGPVATLIVQDGTMQVGDHFITGQTYGKVRAMHDDLGEPVTSAHPSQPVEILGIHDVPSAGDSFQIISDESDARKISSFRKEKAREDSLHRQKHTSLDQLFNSLKPSETKELAVIIKADVQGSVEGLVFALHKIQSDKVNVRIVHQGVGNITENDVLLAVASDAIIIGFNIKGEPKASALAEREGIDLRLYTVIYEVVKEIEAAMLGLVAPTIQEREVGRATVKQIFSVAKLGKVAGCMVENGLVKRDSQVRVFRDGKEIFAGNLETLKRFKDDVSEVKSGYECGVGIRGFPDIQENDVLHFFTFDEIQPTKL